MTAEACLKEIYRFIKKLLHFVKECLKLSSFHLILIIEALCMFLCEAHYRLHALVEKLTMPLKGCCYDSVLGFSLLWSTLQSTQLPYFFFLSMTKKYCY